MLELNKKVLEELDQVLGELERKVQQEREQNQMIHNRILEKELFLKKLEVEQYGEYYY